MNEINDLLKFVTLINKNDPVLFKKLLSNNPSQKLFRLAETLNDPDILDDKKVMSRLYGKTRNSDNYRQLKSRLKSKLVDVLFLNNTERFLKFPVDKALFVTQRNLLAAQILLLQDQRKIAISLTRPAIQSAIYFEHSQLAIMGCRILCHHAALTSSEKDFNHYSQVLTKQLNIFHAELKIIQLYNTILLKVMRTAEYDLPSKKILHNCYLQALGLFKSNRSHIIVLHYYRIAIRYYHSQHLFEKVIQLCKQCNQYLESNPHLYQRSRAGEFALYEMDSCLRLQHYSKGLECAERCLRHFTPYNSPWLVFNEQYFLLSMRTGNYPKALEIYYAVTSSYRFKKLSHIKVELWKIYEAWVNFTLPDVLPKKQFNLFRFLNEVHTVSKDKTGYNYSILITKILLLINIQEKERLVNLEDAFRQYLNRHIKKSKYLRHYHFGVMLRTLFNSDFNSQIAGRKVKPILKKLEVLNKKSLPLEDTEIIPYPMLWKLILEKCNRMK